MAGAFLCTSCAARQARVQAMIQAEAELKEARGKAEQAQTAYLSCLETATRLNECAVLKEIYNERLGTFLFLNEQRQRELDRTITVKKPWWQILLERGRGGQTHDQVHPPGKVFYQTPRR